MKKIFFFLLSFIPAVAFAQTYSIQLPGGLDVVNPNRPHISVYLEADGTPYDSEAEVLTATAGKRYDGLTVKIGAVEWWFDGGIADGDLKVKAPNPFPVGGNYGDFLQSDGAGAAMWTTPANGNGTTFVGNAWDWGGTITAPVAFDGGGIYSINFSNFSGIEFSSNGDMKFGFNIPGAFKVVDAGAVVSPNRIVVDINETSLYYPDGDGGYYGIVLTPLGAQLGSGLNFLRVSGDGYLMGSVGGVWNNSTSPFTINSDAAFQWTFSDAANGMSVTSPGAVFSFGSISGEDRQEWASTTTNYFAAVGAYGGSNGIFIGANTFGASSAYVPMWVDGSNGKLHLNPEYGTSALQDQIYMSGDNTGEVKMIDAPTSDGDVLTFTLADGIKWQPPTGGSTSLTVGTTTITSGTSGRFLYDNGGVLGEATVTGSLGNVVLSNSPTITTPTFSGTATGSISGNAGTATALQNARTINGTSFNGTANITVTAAAGTLTGTTLNATVVTSSLTSVGTIGTGTWQGTAIATTYGGAPSGGTTGQVLTKIDGTNYNYSWQTPTGGGITNGAANNEITKSNGTNIVSSGLFTSTLGDLDLGGSGTSGTRRNITAAGSGSDIGIDLIPKGNGSIRLLGPSFNVMDPTQAYSVTIVPGSASTNGTIYAGRGVNRSLDVIGLDGENVSIINGGPLRFYGGDGYSVSGNGNGGSLYFEVGAKRAAGSGTDGNFEINTLTGKLLLTQDLPTDNAQTLMLVQDPTTQEIKVRDVSSLPGGGGTGTVTQASIVTANGFAGTTATSTTTPAHTITTTVTGMIKGNGTAISAATPGTDYTTSSSTETFTNKTWNGVVIGSTYGGAGAVNGIMKANGSGTVSAATAGTDYAAPGVSTTWGAFDQIFASGNFKIRNPANTFSNIFISSAIAADRQITIPLLTGNDVLVTAAFAQTLTNKTLGSGTVYNGGVIAGTYGGTGVNNSTRTITIGGNFVTSGAFATTLTVTATTNVTLPSTGTLSTLAGAETLTNKTLTNAVVGTQSAGNNSTLAASTAYVDIADALKANIASPTFTGTVSAPTPSASSNTTTVATTAFVKTNYVKVYPAACSDETTAIVGTGQVLSFRVPYSMTLTGLRASLNTAQSSGSVFTVDVRENGVTILSTLMTFDNTETTTQTAATPPVISDTSISDDSIITIHVTQNGGAGAAGLKVTLIGY